MARRSNLHSVINLHLVAPAPALMTDSAPPLLRTPMHFTLGGGPESEREPAAARTCSAGSITLISVAALRRTVPGACVPHLGPSVYVRNLHIPQL